MSARRTVHLPVPVAAPSSGAAVDISLFGQDTMVELAGTFVATYHIEYAITPATWHQLGPDIAVPTSPPRTLPNGARWARVRCSAYTSGNPTCLVAGVEL